jgi:hypothetical protein
MSSPNISYSSVCINTKPKNITAHFAVQTESAQTFKQPVATQQHQHTMSTFKSHGTETDKDMSI